jgi:hypothetical protein
MLKPTLMLAVLAAANVCAAATSPRPTGCNTADYRQFDFWLGDWDAFESTDATTPVARTHVDRIAAGCAVHELYQQSDGLIGDSILSFDAVRKAWQQTWVSNYGSLMVVSGRYSNGALTLQGEMHVHDGSSILQRITWKAEARTVHEWSIMSRDGGKTWVPAFDVVFRKHH